jgi:hypoxanthine phosphoribosyltransferase
LELYDDTSNSISPEGVKCLQWYDETIGPGSLVKGGNVLIVDEVDDSRTTLQYCVEQVMRRSNPAKVGVVVVHNKQKPKKGVLPPDVSYFAGEDVPDAWNCYPW